MQAMEDIALLREYAEGNSEAAFETLVARRVGFVYSAALRQARDPLLAEEITQAVFILLAQKAKRIPDKIIVTGWLFKTTRFVALAEMRRAATRRQREQEAFMQPQTDTLEPNPIWDEISPLLDAALAELGEKDRQALLLRFFENKSLAEVGKYFGAAENTAGKRVNRALEKLRLYFSKHGVVSTTEIMAGAISKRSVQPAPVALAKVVTMAAVAKGATASGSTLTLIQGALKLMAWAKAKTAAAGAIIALLATSATVVTVKHIQEHRVYAWQNPNADRNLLRTLPPQVKIVPSKPGGGPARSGVGGGTSFQPGLVRIRGTKSSAQLITVKGGQNGLGHPVEMLVSNSSGRIMNEIVRSLGQIGLGQSVEMLLSSAYGTRVNQIVLSPGVRLPAGRFDYIDTLTSGAMEGMQQEIKRKFGLVGKFEMRDTNVLVLKVKSPDASGLKPAESGQSGSTSSFSSKGAKYSARNQRLFGLALMLENRFKKPVIDQTGLTNRFDIQLNWDASSAPDDLDNLKQALADQLGLELVEDHQPVEMLVINKAPWSWRWEW